MFRSPSRSPYLKPNRLGDVLAAIQAMALHKQYRQSCADWADWISGEKSRSDYWKQILDDHPEFFRRSRVDGDYALIWRRALPGRYNYETQCMVTNKEYEALTEQEKHKVGQPAVPEAQIKTLIDIAINLHGEALAASRDWRWWIAPAVSFAGSFVGAILAFVTAALFRK
jgi:hypothetical protein